MPDCILMKERKSMGLGAWRNEEGQGGAGEGETVIRIYCIKNLFSSFFLKKNLYKVLHLFTESKSCSKKI